MRPETLEKVAPVAYVFGNAVHFFEDIKSEHQLRIDTELKHQERRAEDMIRLLQKGGPDCMLDGYYVSTGIVYKVYHKNTLVKKITGDEAKNIKRMVKKDADKREVQRETLKHVSNSVDQKQPEPIAA